MSSNEQNFTSETLLDKAMAMLNESYDAEHDSFFVVMTKDGKDPATFVGDQAIIGEINLKTVVAFTVSVISQLCRSMEVHPYTFISRHILGYFIDQERQSFYDLVASQGNAGEEAAETGDLRGLLEAMFGPPDEDEEEFEEPEGEEQPGQSNYYIVNPNLSEIDN
jgi:hypothetical protein